MNRSTAVVSLLALVLTTAFVFASIEFRRMSGSFATLDDRLARLESGSSRGDSPAPAPGDATQPDRRIPAPNGDVAAELARIREEIASLRTSSTDHQPGSAGTPSDPVVASSGGPGLNKNDLSQAVHEALVQKDKSDKEKQAKMYRKQLEVSAKSYADNLVKPLGLTESQKTQVAAVFLDQWSKMNKMWGDTGESEDAEPVDYNKLQAETNEKIKQLLTPEQATKYDEMMKKGNMWGGGGDNSADNSESSK
ncbi:MAG: hypothetical protein K8T20_07445 [Planctomycetes bacterium]|nr:hypothetical protein [Planctomycetota bacterium]